MAVIIYTILSGFIYSCLVMKFPQIREHFMINIIYVMRTKYVHSMSSRLDQSIEYEPQKITVKESGPFMSGKLLS